MRDERNEKLYRTALLELLCAALDCNEENFIRGCYNANTINNKPAIQLDDDYKCKTNIKLNDISDMDILKQKLCHEFRCNSNEKFVNCYIKNPQDLSRWTFLSTIKLIVGLKNEN